VAPVYLETCALMLRAEAGVKSPTPRASHGAGMIGQLLSASTDPIAISPTGLAEFRSVCASRLQDNSSAEAIACDDVWFAQEVGKLMDDVAEGRVLVCDQPAKAIEHAIVLVDLAARDRGRKFRVWDAVHLVTAAAWATSLGASIEFWTCDDDFQKFVDLYPSFARVLAIRSVNP
jgi:hypothetical protein